ncbi:MAG: sigma 54-interacting transcriptional regulator [Polyangiaceae bacterium]
MQLAALQTLALSVAAARSPELVLKEVVRGLGMTDGVALARVWLLESESGEHVLRLRASVGLSQTDSEQRWDRTDGAHARLPLAYGKVGQIAASGKPLLLQKGPRDWLLQPEWAESEGIESFAGQPLVFRSEVLGVVAVFSRQPLGQRELEWLRVFADHAAVAIANARAFEEIGRLKEQLEHERDYLRDAVRKALHPVQMVAVSPAMQRVCDTINAVARTDATVLITGESGVGKELVASAIHDLSPRASAPLVKVNCASVPRELFESEFFGHVRGAFSGASRDREGRFQLADGGTLFLDEVGEIPLELQGKLLRVLQERRFERVGDDHTKSVDVRLIAATNRSLAADVAEGRFRGDLFYRLSVVPVHVPPLRERREDILPLARQFLENFARRLNLRVPDLSRDDEAALLAYPFPGNIRELGNLIERAVVLHRPGEPRLQLYLPDQSRHSEIEELAPPIDAGPPSSELSRVIGAGKWKELERENIENALAQTGWKVSGARGAAALLGIKPSTLSYRMKTLGIVRGQGQRQG